ncbi:MAG: hypothetical protein WCH62_00600 [Candidatus Omnitrophota bacterium]
MKMINLGKNTSNPEVTQISPNGIWLLFNDNEYFLSYEDFPFDSLKDTQKYPLVYIS